MKIILNKIADRGVPDKERLVLRAVNDTTLAYFVVLDTAYATPQSVVSTPKHAFWFPPKSIKAGDWVILYSRVGTNSSEVQKDGTTAHFFFWGQSQVLWDKTGNCAVVMEVTDWNTSPFE